MAVSATLPGRTQIGAVIEQALPLRTARPARLLRRIHGTAKRARHWGGGRQDGLEEFAVVAPVALTLDADDIRAARMPYDLAVTVGFGLCAGPLAVAA